MIKGSFVLLFVNNLIEHMKKNRYETLDVSLNLSRSSRTHKLNKTIDVYNEDEEESSNNDNDDKYISLDSGSTVSKISTTRTKDSEDSSKLSMKN